MVRIPIPERIIEIAAGPATGYKVSDETRNGMSRKYRAHPAKTSSPSTNPSLPIGTNTPKIFDMPRRTPFLGNGFLKGFLPQTLSLCVSELWGQLLKCVKVFAEYPKKYS